MLCCRQQLLLKLSPTFQQLSKSSHLRGPALTTILAFADLCTCMSNPLWLFFFFFMYAACRVNSSQRCIPSKRTAVAVVRTELLDVDLRGVWTAPRPAQQTVKSPIQRGKTYQVGAFHDKSRQEKSFSLHASTVVHLVTKPWIMLSIKWVWGHSVDCGERVTRKQPHSCSSTPPPVWVLSCSLLI